VERSCYLILEQKTLQISVFFSANTTPIGGLVVNALSRLARALAEALVFSYGGNFYMASHRNGKILAKALLNNTKPELVALLSP
jgi:hypothetical protein